MWLLGKPLPLVNARLENAVRGKRRVLEVAAGTGLFTAALAKGAGRVIATDYAHDMVALLADRVRALHLDNVSCEPADIYALPFEPHGFDAVVAANVLHLVPNLEGALDALRRQLAPGGLFLAPTFCHDETWLSRLVSGALMLTGFPGARRFSLATLGAALEGAGFDVRRLELVRGLLPIGYVEATSREVPR